MMKQQAANKLGRLMGYDPEEASQYNADWAYEAPGLSALPNLADVQRANRAIASGIVPIDVNKTGGVKIGKMLNKKAAREDPVELLGGVGRASSSSGMSEPPIIPGYVFDETTNAYMPVSEGSSDARDPFSLENKLTRGRL
jgi:hypothetical protein